MGEIHELFVLALSLVWFAGATPEKNKQKQGDARGVREVRRGTSSMHFHRFVHRSSSHIGPRVFLTKCTTASQPQSLAIFLIADEIARNFRSERQIWPFFIAKCIATATASLPQRNRNLFPRKSRCVQFTA